MTRFPMFAIEEIGRRNVAIIIIDNHVDIFVSNNLSSSPRKDHARRAVGGVKNGETPEPRERQMSEAAVSLPGRLIAFKSACGHVFRVIEFALFALVLFLLGVICLQVFTRYLLHVSLPWTEEIARIALLWAVMLGAAIAMERREHYVISIVSDRLTPSTRWIVSLMANLVGLAFLGILCVYGAKFVETGLRASYVSLGIPRGWVYLALPVGAVLMGISLIRQTAEEYFLRHSQPNPTP